MITSQNVLLEERTTIIEIKDEEIENLKKKISILEELLNTLKTANGDSSKIALENTDLKLKLEEALKDIDKSKIDFETLKNDLEGEIERLTDEVKSLKKQLEMAQGEIQSLEGENKELCDRIEDLETVNDSVNSDSVSVVTEEEDKESPFNEYISDQTDIKKYVEGCLKNYNVEMDIAVTDVQNQKMMKKVSFHGKVVNCKIQNGKFYVKGGGGWYVLRDYIVQFIIKMQASKKNTTSKKLLVSSTKDSFNLI
jgi:chromosome segregation ATPase